MNINQRVAVPVAVGIGAFVAGAAVGYYLGKRDKTVVVPQEDAVVELAREVEEHLDAMRHDAAPRYEYVEIPYDQRGPQSPPTAADVAELEDEHFFPGEPPEPEQPVERVNVFAASDGDWDYETEVAQRTEAKPYILHRDEFFGEEKGYAQITLTYYVKDDILADDADTPIYNYHLVVGHLNFGHGSGDENVFYARNDKHHTEYEILRHETSYAEEILGVEAEEELEKNDLKHSARRFREE